MHLKKVDPVPCEHIFAYYNWLWSYHRSIAYNVLRAGYHQWSNGFIEPEFNNLYG